MLQIETNLERFTEQDMKQILDRLPSTWQKRVLRKVPFKSRLQSTIGYAMLMGILQTHFGFTDLPEIDTDEHGKPHLRCENVFFSISHCNAAVVCVAESTPVAVDVQDLLTDISPALAARIAAPKDAKALSARELTTLWTQKEASAKLDGRGLTIGLEHLPLAEHAIQTARYSSFIISIAKQQAPQHL